VFQCRLSRRRQVELTAALGALIHHGEDHVLILDLGAADRVEMRVTSLGKRFAPVTREPLIV
jgi:CRISPR-associated protein Cas2